MSQTIVETDLGQYHHAYPPGGDTVYPTVTTQEVATEFSNRGYQVRPEVHIPPVPIIEHRVLTKPRAINIGCDVALVEYDIAHSPGHPYVCPRRGSTTCMLTAGQWTAIVNRATMLANGYLRGAYSLPTWARAAYMLGGMGGYGYGRGFGLGGFMDWLSENPEVLSIIGAGFAAAGAALTARRVSELLKANIPKDYLTKGDLPQILAAVQGQGQAGQGAAISKGAQAATMPTWMWPVVIGGGVVGLLLLVTRR